MKKLLLIAAVFVAAVLAISVANAQFGNVKVPTSVSDVKGNVEQVEYDQCKDYIGKYDDNIDYNSKNLFNIFESNKDMRLVKYTKDYAKSDNKWDKENLAKEAKFNFKNTCEVNVNCTKEKCHVYCNRK